jgi:hypothetical protein
MTRRNVQTVLGLLIIAVLAVVLVYVTPPIRVRPQNLLHLSLKHTIVTSHGRHKVTVQIVALQVVASREELC